MRFIKRYFFVLPIVLVVLPGPAIATQPQPFKPLEMSQKQQALAEKKKRREEQREANARIQKVDINHATADALKQLPGVDDKVAEKIIAGRPYGSKAWLLTRNVIEPGIYEGIRKFISAGQSSGKSSSN